jgi:alcohol dehydrogenase (NADP+)
MQNKVRGYAAQSATAPLAPHTLTRRDPRPDDVAMDVLYCGVCHTDIHRVRDEWGGSRYPVVPGHEVIGRVTEVGSAVKGFKPGDIVGVGCLVDSCRHCDSCEKGLEQYCAEGAVFAYNSLDRHDGSVTQGGYSERLLVSDKFVLHIPSKLDLRSAGPLLCAGISTYSPLRHWKVGKGSKVGIVALGGLGHMALKLAKAFGAEVTLFTRVAGQEQEARRLGADHVVLITDPKQMQAVARRLDVILDTVPNDHDINPYIASLTRDGALVMIGQFTPLHTPVNPGALIDERRMLAGSVIGGIAETQEMLEFCAEKGIGCDVEMIRMQDINTAYERMLKGDVRYRFVIDMASLKV